MLAIVDRHTDAADERVAVDKAKAFVLQARSRVEQAPDSGKFKVITKATTWDPGKTAVVVCDMWSTHWCKGATERVAEMAPRVNAVVAKARERGALIIHCPSGGMGHYNSTPMRKLARQAPKIKTKTPLAGWCYLDSKVEGAMPISESDMSCDCPTQCKGVTIRTQIAQIKIKEGDAITDSFEAFYLMKQRGITNVMIMGVHTNMCVLGRPFGVRQLVKQGQNVLLIRDLTDAFYNSRKKPYVNRFRGTELVVEHIEKYLCPTITSADILGGKPFRFAKDPGTDRQTTGSVKK